MMREAVRRLRVLRLAYLARKMWQRVRRPVTLGTRAIVLDGEGRVLLIRHSYVGGWHLPGGSVGRRETIDGAVRRELGEEAGIEVRRIERLLGLYARLGPGASDHVAVFVIGEWVGSVRVDAFEIVDARFFAFDGLPADTTPGTRRRLAEHWGERPVSTIW
jgi:8-oxo-dGTP pyrophosphatase MutT (NUDIX family)